MQSSPLVSIITVVRNDAERLLYSLSGVAQFKGACTELIVVDGNSTDDTLSVIQSNRHVIDTYISEPDKGIYDAMNKGISLSTGKYLLFLNAGDELLADVESLVAAIPDSPVIIYGKANMFAPDGRHLYVKGKPLKGINQFLKGMPLCHQAILYRRESMIDYDLRYTVYADRALTYHLLCAYGLSEARFVDCLLVNYIEGGFSNSFSDRVLQEEQNVFYRNVGKHHYILIKKVKALFKQHIKTPLRRMFGKRPRN